MLSDRAKGLLNKVYDELEKVDVSTLKFDEMKDFLGIVQTGQFLESAATGFGFNSACAVQTPCGFGGSNLQNAEGAGTLGKDVDASVTTNDVHSVATTSSET